MLEGETGARTNLYFVAMRDGEREARRNRVPLTWTKRDVLGGNDIEPGGMLRGPRRKRPRLPGERSSRHVSTSTAP